jgi:predicted 2-oxoglutarate/Fe(II)-dependent dioxygenase YbiX/peroxiredoxin
MPPLQPGQPAPWFAAPTHGNPNYAFSSTAGRYVVLIFMPAEEAAAAPICGLVEDGLAAFTFPNIVCFGVVRAPMLHARLKEHLSLRWFLDADGALGRLYGATEPGGGETPHWLILDPLLRVMAGGPLGDVAQMFAVVAGLPPLDLHAGAPVHAPVLIVPRVLEPQFCKRLIEVYKQEGGAPSGVMREIGGKTVGVLSETKRRRDADITDEALQSAIRGRIVRRLLPEIQKAFQFKVTRMERYIVAAYDAEEGGFFRAHRDNTTLGAVHRQFACSINLNAEEHEGGDLRFPEFGSRTYRPPTGGAVVFSCALLHEATSVTRGTRYAFLPFFYDEAAAKVREANMSNVTPGLLAEAAAR